jgi:hypothetical protein
MQFDIRNNAAQVARQIADVHKRHIPFATVYAMTLTARDVKTEEISVMRRRLDRPTPYALNALQVKPATKQSLVASVEFREFGGTPAKRFLNPQVHGGERSQKSHERQIAPLLRGVSFLVPARGTPVDNYGNVKGATFKRIITQLKVSSDPLNNASGSKRSKRARKASAFFVNASGTMVMERKGTAVQPVLIGVKAPRYTKRFPFYETAAAKVAERMPINFSVALERAISTSNTKGKWS